MIPSKRSEYFCSLLFLISGAVFIAFSGRAEGFASPRSGVIFVVLFSWIYFIQSLYKAIVKKQFRPFAVMSAIFLNGMLVYGLHLDERFREKREWQGDKIVEIINSFHQKNSRYPASLDELDAKIDASLEKQNFSYHLEKDEFLLSFDFVSFLICSRSADSDWKCDD